MDKITDNLVLILIFWGVFEGYLIYLFGGKWLSLTKYSQKDAVFVKFMIILLHDFTKKCYFCEK
jgi:hypothetical protein